MKTTKFQYKELQISVIEMTVEQGFAISGNGFDPFLPGGYL